jgi:hypothetical protein
LAHHGRAPHFSKEFPIMSYSPDVGLILGLGIDPSGVKPGLDQAQTELAEYEKALDDATREVNAGFEETDRGLLSNRESARLLSEELGLHLPRGITSAIGRVEALQTALAAAGSVAIAFFAAKELGQGLSTLQGWLDKIEGIDRAAKDTFRESLDASLKQIDANEKILAQLTGRNLGEVENAAKQYRIMVETAELAARIADEERQQLEIVTKLPALWELVLTPVGMVYKSIDDIYKMLAKTRDATQDLDHAQQAAADAAVENATRIVEAARKEGEVQREEVSRTAEAAQRAAMEAYESNQREFHASEQALKRQMELQDHMGRAAVESARKEEEAREHTAVAVHRLTEELRKQGEQEVRNAEELGKEASRQISDITRIGNEQERAAERGKNEALQRIEDQHNEAVKAIQDHNAEAQAIAALKGDYKAMADAAIAAWTAMRQANANYMKQLVDEHKVEQKAANDATNAEIEGIGALAEGAAQLAGSKKGYYAVKAGEEIAAGLETLAEGTWPPNPLALIASGIHFESAAEYAKIAGTGAGHRTGAGGAGAPSYESERGAYEHGGGGGGGGASYGEQDVAGTGLAPGATGSTGGRLNIYVIGDEAAFIAKRVNEADAAGHFMQVTSSRRSAPAQG